MLWQNNKNGNKRPRQGQLKKLMSVLAQLYSFQITLDFTDNKY